MKKLLLIAAAALATASCGSKHSITASFAGLTDEVAYVQQVRLADYNRAPMALDTVAVAGGKFVYDLTDSVPVYLNITFPQQQVFIGKSPMRLRSRTLELVVKPGERLSVKGNVSDDYLQYSVAGKGFNRDYAAARDLYREPAVKADSITIHKVDSVFKDQARIEALDAERDALFAQVAQLQNDYIAAHPGSDVAAWFVLQRSQEDLGEQLAKLTDPAKQGLFADLIARITARYEDWLVRKAARERLTPGAQAPDFVLKDLAGDEVALSSLKGKVTVLDFWGSWCIWCLHGVPDMKAAYARHSGKLQIVGIACNDTDAEWRACIEQYGLDWTQLFNGEGDADVSKLYGIEGYPTKIILDKELRIVEVFVGEGPEFYAKLDEVMGR